MSTIISAGSGLGTALSTLLTSNDEIEPGSAPSYQLCKTIYTYHPIGKKMVDAPISKAQSQKRKISIPDSPEDMIREQFERVWKNISADRLIRNTFRLSRVYGLSTICAMVPGAKPTDPIDYPNLYKTAAELRFNILDPLNTSGSLVLNQDPNASDFLKVQNVSIAGVPYNPARCVVMQNEDPIYIDYTTSAFGYTGRSVYQRSLLPLKSFIQSMIADDLVTIKVGVLIAKMKNPGSFIDNVMQNVFGMKRDVVKEARVGNVIGISTDGEEIESLDLTNIPDALSGSRKNILENIAVSADMPAMLLNSETFAEGFADGSEDAKAVAEYIDDIRMQMQPLYDYFDKIVQYLAWNPEFYKTVQKTFPEDYGSVTFNDAFYRWCNSFATEWPSLLREPESELIKKDAVKLESVIAAVQVLLPVLDPDNKRVLVEWLADTFNELKLLFPNPLEIDADMLLDYLEEQQARTQDNEDQELKAKTQGPSPNRKFGDSNISRAVQMLPPPVRGKIRHGITAIQ